MSDRMTPEQRLASSSITLPAALPAFGQYVPAVVHGNQLWVGGHFGTRPDGSVYTGRCGQDVDTPLAREAARSAAINLVATIRETLGSLDRVVRIATVHGVVNATPEFVEHTAVIDAASDVLVEIFGGAGHHTRLAVGVSSLPANLVLEIQAVAVVAGEVAGEVAG
ncbi:MAG: RidA family protein [Acidimicrobiales bacterium]